MSNPSDTQAAAPNTTHTIPQATTDPTDLVLLIFIHGFKGTDSTFGEFPQRLQHILSESIDNTVVESVVFPAYETKGELNAAVVRFADWLTDLTVKREVANGGAGKAKVVLCGHSMGGLLAADALLEFVRTRPDRRAPIWPKIVACIAYDTPYLGLHPGVVKNSTNQAAQYARTAQNVLNSFKTWRSKTPSGAAAAAAAAGGAAAGVAAVAAGPAPIDTNASPSPDASKERDEGPRSPTTPKTPTAESSEGTTVTSIWQKWAAPAALAIGGAVLAGTAAGTAYYKREEIGVGYTWVTDHLKYVGNLWSKDQLEERLERLLALESGMGVLFHTFFTDIPASPPAYPDNRTFIVLPRRNSPLATHFMPNRNTCASDEIQAHTGMFDTKTNDGYYELGLVTAKLIREAVFNARRAEANVQIPQSPPRAQAQSRAPPQQPSVVKAVVQESVASQQPAPASAAAVGPPVAAAGAAIATTVAGATAASVAASASAPPPPPAADDEEEEEDDDDDDDEEEESEEEEEHIPVMEKPHIMAEKVEAAPAAPAPKADEEAEDDEDDEDEDDDDDDEEEEDDDEEEEDEDEEDEDEDEEEEAEAQPAKK